MEYIKEANAHMGISTKIDMDENGKDIDIIKYWGMDDSLLCLTPSGSDVMFCVCI